MEKSPINFGDNKHLMKIKIYSYSYNICSLVYESSLYVKLLTSTYICSHLTFNFGFLIEFFCLKDWFK